MLDNQLAGREKVTEDSSIADIAIFPWTRTYKRQRIDINAFPNVVDWRARMFNRPAVMAGVKGGAEWREDQKDLREEQRKQWFGES